MIWLSDQHIRIIERIRFRFESVNQLTELGQLAKQTILFGEEAKMKKSLLTLIALVLGAMILVACAAPEPEVIIEEKIVEVEVEKEVEKEVEVTRVVVEEVEVEKVVEKEVEVEVEKIVEVIVDPTACNVDAPAEAAEINMIGWTYPIVDYFAEELEKCNDVENIEVNTQALDSGSAHEQIKLALAAGGESPYDIIMTTEADIHEYNAEGWLLPLNDLIEKYGEEYNIAEIAGLDSHAVDGVIYGIPLELNTMHFFYRPDLLDQYELEVPNTWDDVIANCGVLQEEASIDLPFTMNLHAGWAWRIEFNNMLGAFGGEQLNADRTPAFNGPEGVQAMEKILEVIDACMGEEGLTYSIDDSQVGMATGGLAMAHTWASRAASMDDPEFSNFVGEIGFAPAPRAVEGGPHGAPFGGASYAIPANSAVDADLLFRVIMESVDYRSQLEASELGIASRASVSEASDARYLPAVFEIVNDGLSVAPDPAHGIMNAALGNWLPKAALGELSVQEILDGAAEEYLNEATAQGYIDG